MASASALMIDGNLVLVLDASEIFLEYAHDFIEGIVVLLWIIDVITLNLAFLSQLLHHNP